MATYDPASYGRQFDSAWAKWSPVDYQGGLPPELLAAIQQQASSSIGHLDADGNWVNSPNPNSHIVSPDGRWQLSALPTAQGPEYQLNDLVQGGPGEAFYSFDGSGKLKEVKTGAKAMGGLQGVGMVIGAALSMGALSAAMGAGAGAAGAGTAAGTAGATAGALDLGGGLSMLADGSIVGASSSLGAFPTNAGIMSSIGAGGTTAMGAAGGANWLDAVKAAGSSVFGGGGGGGGGGGVGSWTDLVQPAIQAGMGIYGAKQTEKATDSLVQAQRESAALFEPWRQAGAWGIGKAATMLGKDGAEAAKAAFETDPGYQWRLNQGENALTRAAAARGMLGSGKYLKDAMRFNQGEASQEFGNSLNRLLAVAGMGQTATNSSAGYTSGAGEAAAAGRIGAANALTGAVGQGMSMYNNAQGNRTQNLLLERMLAGRGI